MEDIFKVKIYSKRCQLDKQSDINYINKFKISFLLANALLRTISNKWLLDNKWFQEVLFLLEHC